MTAVGHDSLNTRTQLQVGSKSYAYCSLDKAAAQLGSVSSLPFSMKVCSRICSASSIARRGAPPLTLLSPTGV